MAGLFTQYKNRSVSCGFCNKKRGEEKMKKMKGSILKTGTFLYFLFLDCYLLWLYCNRKMLKKKVGKY